MASEYRRLVARLAKIDAEVSALRAEADDWYAATVGNAEARLAEAQERLAEAKRWQREAEHLVSDVDMRVYGRWETFVAVTGRNVERRGGRPHALRPPPDETRDAYELIDDVDAQLGRPGRGLGDETRQRMIIFGVLGGLLAGLAGWGVRVAGRSVDGDLAVVLPVLALLLTLALGPILALIAAKVHADRRHAALESGTVTVVLLTSLVVAGLMLVPQTY